ncbi:ribosomal protein S18-alanine N-acetyltransferase [Carnobacterium sp. ISL-102]|uniref:ribosomal protein S18-alanine N-acetyltransferase n=1 Tax=Carnobacterium sp. ISL-102 TaxID=2819142 RepID=UPI001BE61141|nr:ribosomal protein S18-alanine N-acetyltransferase [Carnobacterium sp. ISL-102]MBT2732067.1 ribosomal protein S18-alanine N-acetyltransferase [Carnobacterium sp. ISL-102]
MLKKFKQWFRNEEIDLLSQPEFSKNLAERSRLERETIQLSDGSFLKASIGTVSDIADILKIESLCYNGKTPWNKKALEDEIKNNTRAIYLIVRESDKAIGFIGAWLVEEEAHITNVAVIPSCQERGVATFLITELQKISQHEGMQKINLEVRISNEKAQRLYDRLGFQKEKIKKDYYTGDLEDALEMSKIL